MRYILRKFVDADSVPEALAKDGATPIHDCYLKEGEEPRGSEGASAIGFQTVGETNGLDGVFITAKKG